MDYICASENNWQHTSKYGITFPDCVYYCMRENGERVIESYWRRKDGEKPDVKDKFLIKERKKMIFVLETEKAYGFGFGDNDTDRSIVLYIRTGEAALLVWSDSASNAINYVYEVNEKNPENLDCLVGFMVKDGEDKGSEDRKEESGVCHR